MLLLSQRLVRVVTTLILKLSFVLVRLAIRYLNRSLPNPIPCVLVKPEVLAEDTEQPRFLPWEVDTTRSLVEIHNMGAWLFYGKYIIIV